MCKFGAEFTHKPAKPSKSHNHPAAYWKVVYNGRVFVYPIFWIFGNQRGFGRGRPPQRPKPRQIQRLHFLSQKKPLVTSPMKAGQGRETAVLAGAWLAGAV